MSELAAQFAREPWVMFSISCCSLLSIAIIIERFWFYYKTREDDEQLLLEVRSRTQSGNVEDAIRYCENRESPTARILKDVLISHKEKRKNYEKTVEDAVMSEEPRLERFVGALAILANAGPLMGLLGTVIGIIHAFAAIGSGEGAVSANELGKHIGLALWATAFGLIVAIPSYICAQYFTNRNNATYTRMRTAASHVINILETGKEA